MATTYLFVDADNQSPILASTLSKFLRTIGRDSAKAIVAGNGVGDRVRNWEESLTEALPGIEISCHVAPNRKQSADVRLMFELARFYHAQPDPSSLLIVFSRDELMVAATEFLVELGHSAMLVVGASASSNALHTDVPFVVLTTPQQIGSTSSTTPTAQPVAPPAATQNQNKIDTQTVLKAVTAIRQKLSPNKQGGYAASAVGQVLAQLGHDKATRSKIVSQIQNLQEVGTGSEKRLIF